MTHRWDTRGADAEVGSGGGSESSDALAAHVLASIERAKEGVGVHWRIDEELAKLGKWQRGRTFAQHEVEAHEDEVLRHDIILRPCISIRIAFYIQDYIPR